ncbi:MAG: cache and HAMP domain-containing protein [Flavobacteriales bacterium]|nr:cache and HAMP domain-containing protein [Flavobacteriales bacterium]MCB9448088.1 cache and HAMP domain-containing protein [Flavobacteriales bacterium]
MRTLRGKIIFLTCCIVAGVSLLMGVYNYLLTVDNTMKMAIEGLAGETRLMAAHFRNGYDEMKNDLFVVSRTPPVQGMIRSMNNGDLDPLDQSTTSLWRHRMETIFKSVMDKRPHYTQMRYIGMADGGLELVRVNRNDSLLESVSPDMLQMKGEEPYMKATSGLDDGQVYFSEVTYNREHGKEDGTHLLTVRAIVPVYDERNVQFGVIVINADYQSLLRYVFAEIATDKQTFVVNQAGDYMQYMPGKGVTAFEYHNGYSTAPPDFIQKILGHPVKENYFLDDVHVDYVYRMGIPNASRNAYLDVVVRVPKKELLADAYQAQRETMVLALVLLGLSLLAATLFARRLTVPLRRMTENIKHAATSGESPVLPLELRDEIGELARAFHSLANELKESEAKSRAFLQYANDGSLPSTKGQSLKATTPPASEFSGTRRMRWWVRTSTC